MNKTIDKLKEEYEKKFTFEIAPSIDPKAEAPYNQPQRYVGKITSVADSAGTIPNGVRYILSDEMFNFFLPHLKDDNKIRRVFPDKNKYFEKFANDWLHELGKTNRSWLWDKYQEYLKKEESGSK